MQLTTPQLQTLKQWVIDNANSVFEQSTADLLNAVASPDYFVWRTTLARADVYDAPGPAGSLWDWTVFKNQSPSEQGAWREMFMSDLGRISLVNWRAGVGKIFTGSAQANAQRDHVLAVGRRPATVGEKLFATAVTNPPANSGNDTGQARGSAANPDNLGVGAGTFSAPGAEGSVTLQNLLQADAS
jgi:hypothetical protein